MSAFRRKVDCINESFYRKEIFDSIIWSLDDVSLHGNSKGVILFVRICFVFLEIFVSCFLFRTILYYAKSYCAAVFSALCVLLYVRGNIITISYYSLGFHTPGLCFGGVWILGSNVGERVMNMSFLFMNIWAICFFINISCKYGKFAKTIMQLPVYLLVCVLFVIRFFDIYRDGSLWNLRYQISSGCMKGIYTEENRGKLYEKTVEMLHINVTNDDVIVVIGCNPWIYIDVSGKCGAYTTWNIADGEELLSIYYEKNPEKIPSIIINVSKELGVYESWKYSSHGNGLHEPKELKIGILLSEIIEEGKYRCIEKMGNVIYRK